MLSKFPRLAKPSQGNKSKLEKKKGIGVSNIKKQLSLQYPDKHVLKIVESEDHYKVGLSINL